jgi:hypothetical protein
VKSEDLVALPVTIANGRMVEHGEQAFVKPLQRAVGWFERRADEVRRNTLPATFERPWWKNCSLHGPFGDPWMGGASVDAGQAVRRRSRS